MDPRLLSSKRLTSTSLLQKYAGIQHRFQPHTKASEIIRNVNLRGKVAMVTGANSGLGKHYELFGHLCKCVLIRVESNYV